MNTPKKESPAIHKKVEKREEFFVAFTPEECQTLGLQAGDKFEVIEEADGLLLKKFATIELDLADFDRATLEFLVEESLKLHCPIEDIITNILTEAVEREEKTLSEKIKSKGKPPADPSTP